jgi:hypothetical protein
MITTIFVETLLLQSLAVDAITINMFRTENKLDKTERDIPSPLNGGPNSLGCYATNLKVGSTSFNLFLDSGSSNLIIPGTGLNNYEGPAFNTNGKTSVDGKSYSGYFTGGSSWTGKIYNDTVTIRNIL